MKLFKKSKIRTLKTIRNVIMMNRFDPNTKVRIIQKGENELFMHDKKSVANLLGISEDLVRFYEKPSLFEKRNVLGPKSSNSLVVNEQIKFLYKIQSEFLTKIFKQNIICGAYFDLNWTSDQSKFDTNLLKTQYLKFVEDLCILLKFLKDKHLCSSSDFLTNNKDTLQALEEKSMFGIIDNYIFFFFQFLNVNKEIFFDLDFDLETNYKISTMINLLTHYFSFNSSKRASFIFSTFDLIEKIISKEKMDYFDEPLFESIYDLLCKNQKSFHKIEKNLFNKNIEKQILNLEKGGPSQNKLLFFKKLIIIKYLEFYKKKIQTKTYSESNEIKEVKSQDFHKWLYINFSVKNLEISLSHLSKNLNSSLNFFLKNDFTNFFLFSKFLEYHFYVVQRLFFKNDLFTIKTNELNHVKAIIQKQILPQIFNTNNKINKTPNSYKIKIKETLSLFEDLIFLKGHFVTPTVISMVLNFGPKLTNFYTQVKFVSVIYSAIRFVQNFECLSRQ